MVRNLPLVISLVLIGLLVLISGCFIESESPIRIGFSFDKDPHLNEITNLKLTVLSHDYLSNAQIYIILPEEIEIVEGDLEWRGDLIPNEKIEVEIRIKPITEGDLQIRASFHSDELLQSYYFSLPVTQIYIGDLNTSQLIEPSGKIFYNETWECSNNRECDFNQQCINYTCITFACDGYCRYIEDHQCLTYECCADSDCDEEYFCIDNECRTSIEDPYNKIAFSSSDGIYVMNNDGTNIEKIVISPSFYGGDPISWSPDGEKIAFGHGDIYIINIDGIDKTFLTSGYYPSWTSDGESVIYSLEYAIGSVDINTNKSTIIYEMGASISFPAISPNGEKIAFGVTNAIGMNPTRVNIINIDGTNNFFLASGDEPSWSPDGNKIVYLKYDGFSPSGIYIINANSKEETFLVDGFSPSWSPDGNKIVYTQNDRSGISIIDEDGSNQVDLTDFGRYSAWSPFQE